MACETIELFHAWRLYGLWKAEENQLPCVFLWRFVRSGVWDRLSFFSCFSHVVNIANMAVMGHITQIAAVENATVIWEYDRSLPNNCILEGSLDVIAAIRTIVVKVCIVPLIFSPPLWVTPFQIQASRQWIEYFEKLQLQCKIPEPLRTPLHSNIQWGSAHCMLEHSYRLQQVSN